MGRDTNKFSMPFREAKTVNASLYVLGEKGKVSHLVRSACPPLELET